MMPLSQLVVFGLGVASLFVLLTIDRVTQGPRYWLIKKLDKAGGFIPYHLMYMLGCPLCLTMWLSGLLYAIRDTRAGQIAVVILATRFVAYVALRYVQMAKHDWPNRDDGSAVPWPPVKDDTVDS